MQMLGNLEAKRNFIFSALPRPVQKKNVPTPLTVPIADALHCYAFAPGFHFLCPSAGYPCYATAGCERKDKKIVLLNSVPPPNFFESFAPLSAALLIKASPRFTDAKIHKT